MLLPPHQAAAVVLLLPLLQSQSARKPGRTPVARGQEQVQHHPGPHQQDP